MASVLVRQMLDAGIHFGNHASRWNPKMKPYIYGKRNKIHIIDIRETLRGLLRAQRFLSKVVAEGQDVLFVGTKRQAREIIKRYAEQCGMPYVTERWLGGTLTNFRTIRSRVRRLEELEALMNSPEWERYSKKMRATLTREWRKINRNLGGIRNMERLPGALVVVDVRKEINALREARALGIPTICLIDTDGDPDLCSIPIPGNDDGMRAIELIIAKLAEAVEEGKRGRQEPASEPVAAQASAATVASPPAESQAAAASQPASAQGEQATPAAPDATDAASPTAPVASSADETSEAPAEA